MKTIDQPISSIAAGITEIAEHHGLHVDGEAEIIRNIVDAAIVLPCRIYSRQASVWIVKPGGTGSPALVIWPSHTAEKVNVLPSLHGGLPVLSYRVVVVRVLSIEGSYGNYISDEGDAFARASYGPNYDRLVALKNKYDPSNFFRMNHNIKPTA